MRRQRIFKTGVQLKRLRLDLAGSRGPSCGVPLSAIVLKSAVGGGRAEEVVGFKFRTRKKITLLD